MNQNDIISIQVTLADVNTLSSADPLVAEKLKSVALIRILGEATAKIEVLKEELAGLKEDPESSKNGNKIEEVPANA